MQKCTVFLSSLHLCLLSVHLWPWRMQILFPDQSCDGWDDKAHQSSATDGSPVSSSVSSEQDSDLVSGRGQCWALLALLGVAVALPC